MFVDLEKAYDKVPREEVGYCLRKSGLAEKYVKIVQDMYDDSITAMRCAVGVTEGFEVKVILHQGSALIPCLFAMVMDRMTGLQRKQGTGRREAGELEICFGEKRNESQSEKDRLHVCE